MSTGMEPMFETPNYQLSFLLMSSSISLIVYLCGNISAFLIIITGYVEAQMLALSEELTYLWADAEEHFAEADDVNDGEEGFDVINKAREAKLNHYVKEHLKNIA